MIQLPQEIWDKILSHKKMDAEFRAQRKLEISKVYKQLRYVHLGRYELINGKMVKLRKFVKAFPDKFLRLNKKN